MSNPICSIAACTSTSRRRTVTPAWIAAHGGEQAPDMHDGFTIQFSAPWEDEHGIVLEVIDGAIADTF